MKRKTHYIQDACEYYAVAKMQELMEKAGHAKNQVSSARHQEYDAYLTKRGLTHKQIESGDYVQSIDKAVPIFLNNLLAKHPDEKMNFINIEKEARDRKMKADFQIDFSRRSAVDFSLKNYKGGIRRIQLRSGTFNSFVLNFLFESCRVGTFRYKDYVGHEHEFRSADKQKRDKALEATGYSSIIPLIHEMDEIHESMRESIFNSGEYEFYDEAKFDSLRKRVGLAGVKVAHKIMDEIDLKLVQKQIIDMTGFDGKEELLAVSPSEHLDSYTNPRFHKFRNDLLHENCKLSYQNRAQSLIFTFKLEGHQILSVDIPFTINANGAWFRDEPFDGEIYHPKEKMLLKYGQLRPRKSREIATSINTYADLGNTYIYSDDEI